MTPTIIDLRAFYGSELGQFAAQVIGHDIEKCWPSVKDQDVAVLGYGLPFVAPWQSQAKRLIHMMPEQQGVAYWPEAGANLSCLAHLDALPLADDSLDRVLMIHALEAAQDPAAALQEVWRVLRPEGCLLAVVPHRRGAWAHSDTTPFGMGEPYSRTQLDTLLRHHGFMTQEVRRSLIAPPSQSWLGLTLAPYLEACGCVFSRLGGVLLVQAKKQAYTPAFIKSRSKRRRLVLPMPVPALGAPAGREYLAFEEKSCKL